MLPLMEHLLFTQALIPSKLGLKLQSFLMRCNLPSAVVCSLREFGICKKKIVSSKLGTSASPWSSACLGMHKLCQAMVARSR